MGWINHYLSIAAVKAFANGQLLKKVTAQTKFNSETDPGDKWFSNLRKNQSFSNRKP